MNSQEPSVVLEMDCWGSGEIAGAPDMFRLRITADVMMELEKLKRFYWQTSVLYGSRFAGQQFDGMDVPFAHFEAESSEGEDDDHVDRRLDCQMMHLRVDGFRLVARMRVAGAQLTSDKITDELLQEKFSELRALITEASISAAIDAGQGVDQPPVSTNRMSAKGMSL